MREPCFLTLAEVVEIHADQITRYGGQDGVRDLGLLESAPACALVFLEMNGVSLTDPKGLLKEAMTAVASGRMGKAELAKCFRRLPQVPR